VACALARLLDQGGNVVAGDVEQALEALRFLVARRKGGVSPPERSGGGQRPVCTSEARKIGDTLAPRDRGGAP
jgi:hypothetical protein